MAHRVLIIERDPEAARNFTDLLGDVLLASAVPSLQEARAELEADGVEAVVVALPADADGLEACEALTQEHPRLPVLWVDHRDDTERAMAAIRLGVADYLHRSAPAAALRRALQETLRRHEIEQHLTRAEPPLPPTPGSRADSNAPDPVDGIVGRSPEIREVRSLLRRLASSHSSVLITGESGTGKEVVARALHEVSSRVTGPFVAINCAAIPPRLLESELFGHTRGAFTHARQSRRGLLVQAHGGTLLLDEVAAMPLPLQAKLLRALDERAVRPVGEDAEVPFDARVVAATNQDLAQEAEAGRFRSDLFFRLNVIHIRLPPLRERGYDVLLLALLFIERSAARMGKGVVGLTPTAAARLLAYPWPGNVRELENSIESAVALTRYDHIGEADLPARVRRGGPPAEESRLDRSELVPLEMLECAHIAHVMRRTQGNKTEAAQLLGIDRKTLYRKLRKHGLEDLETEGRATGKLRATSRQASPER